MFIFFLCLENIVAACTLIKAINRSLIKAINRSLGIKNDHSLTSYGRSQNYHLC